MCWSLLGYYKLTKRIFVWAPLGSQKKSDSLCVYVAHVTTSGPMWAKYKRYGRKQLKSIYTILHGNQIESKASHKDFTRQSCWGDLVKS